MSKVALTKYLHREGITLAEFARRVEVEDSTVLRWARGERVPSAYFASRIAGLTHGAVPVSGWPIAPEGSVRLAKRQRKGPRRVVRP